MTHSSYLPFPLELSLPSLPPPPSQSPPSSPNAIDI
jgi:hypothetical protein